MAKASPKSKAKKAGTRRAAKTKSTVKAGKASAAGTKKRAGMPATGESVKQRTTRAAKILAKLKKAYPDADCALVHTSALELLVATILSAQSTDENVNRVTPGLFKKYKDAAAFASAPAEQMENDIRSTGFFRQKTKSIQGACRILMEEHGGEVPDRMEELIRLPGVARKTANVVLGTWFGQNEGVVVDTHVGRLSQRLGLSWRAKDDKDAGKIEADLMEILPDRKSVV